MTRDEIRPGFPPFDAVFLLFQYGGTIYGPAARTADRAVLVELRLFLAGFGLAGMRRSSSASRVACMATRSAARSIVVRSPATSTSGFFRSTWSAHALSFPVLHESSVRAGFLRKPSDAVTGGHSRRIGTLPASCSAGSCRWSPGSGASPIPTWRKARAQAAGHGCESVLDVLHGDSAHGHVTEADGMWLWIG